MSSPRFGLGFRTQHAQEIAQGAGRVDWLEVLSDHHLGVGGPRRALLERLRRDREIALHGVGLGIAGSDPLDAGYVEALAELAERSEPLFVSDHLCWTAHAGQQSHDLLPVAYTAEVLLHVAARVARVQDRLQRPLLLENATAYVAFRASEMDEAEFFAELCRATGCGVLLDVNNLYVNACNLGADPARMLALLPESAVGYLHVAGHAALPDVRIDTHADAVPAEVWELFAAAVRRFPRAHVILERDDDLPPYAQLVAELDLARAHREAALAAPVAPPVREDVAVRACGDGAPSWSGIQRAFWRAAIASDPDPELRDLLDAQRPVRPARGLRVYSDGYVAGLRAALATNFASLARVLGREDWDRLCSEYLAAHPPRGHGFVGLGAAFADFVRTHRFECDHGVPPCVFAEMAELEQAQLEAQDAPEPAHRTAPADLAAIGAADWENARISFAPDVRLVRATHDVAPCVLAAARGEAPERPRAAEQTYWVARSGSGVVTEPLAEGDAALARALLAGQTFGVACAASGLEENEAAQRGASWLVNACAQGWIAAVEVAP